MPKVEYIYVITAIKWKHGVSGPGTTNCSIEFMTTLLHKVSMSFPVMKEHRRPSLWHTRLSFKPLLAQTAFFALRSSLFHERSLKWQPVRLVLCVLGHDVAAGVNGGGVRAVSEGWGSSCTLETTSLPWWMIPTQGITLSMEQQRAVPNF